MSDNFDKKSIYNNILNRIRKKSITYEGVFIVKKIYFTDNIFFYFLCILFRFIHLFVFSGNYAEQFSSKEKDDSKSFQNYLLKLTIYNLLQQYQLSFRIYSMFCLIIFFLFIIRVITSFIILKKFKNYKHTNKWPLPSKPQIILDHVLFILFPYIIEYLSFSYYIYFFPSQFIINIDDTNDFMLMAIIIINTILIIGYNIDNYVNIICSNKIYTITFFDAYTKRYEKKLIKNNKLIAYKCSNLYIYSLIFFQNFVIFLTLEKYINKYYIMSFKIITSIIILLMIIILFFSRLHEFDYINLITITINVLFLFCFYSIIIDFFAFILKYRIFSELNEITYALIKIILSYITYLSFIMKKQTFFESEIIKVLFQEKNNTYDKHFINSFYYLHYIMLKIKEQNKVESILLLVKFLNKHIERCNKLVCNCKLFNFLKEKESKNINDEKLKEFLSELLINLNYLFESSFIEYDFYNNYDIIILLSEHFCHLRNNPLMAFSLINTFILKQKSKFSKIQMVILYELCQKYIYYLSGKIMHEIEKEIKDNKIELLSNQKRENELKSFYNNLIMSYNSKKYINDYIDNEIKILKYRIIFEDSLEFKFDENFETITSVKINFFNQNTKIDNPYKGSKKKNKNKVNKNSGNLNNIIYLLKKEQYYYINIINSINKMDLMRDIPIFMIFKYFLFFDFFEGGKIPDEVLKKLNDSLYENSNLYNPSITTNEYIILKKKYNEQNNRIDSKTYVIVEFKKDLRTKYFTENDALKLGYKQKDIINESIDFLMPKEFCKSHQNTIKQLIIGNQIRFSMSKQSYYFDKTSTMLYSANFEVSLIYNISKSLIVMLESIFNYEDEYRFMLNNNFDLLSNSKNFVDEYNLNQKIFQSFEIKLLDILGIKPENLHKKFENEYKKIHFQRIIRAAKTEEYFIPQLYVPPEEKSFGLMNHMHFNTSKNNIINKVINSYNKEENEDNNINNNEDNEYNNFIKKNNIKYTIKDLFTEHAEIVFHNTYKKTLNKGHFIENIARELTKIPDNDLMMENDKVSYNLIIKSKKLISNLLTKSELANYFIGITIKFSFYYDKPFYFVTIYDEKKLYLKISKSVYENKEDNLIPKLKESNNIKNKIPRNKTRNKNKYGKNNLNIKNKSKLDNSRKENDVNNEILTKIGDSRKNINKDKFISIIKLILSIIIICILIIYLLIINFQLKMIKTSEKILYSYCYNINSRDIIIYIFSILFQVYFDFSGLINNTIINENQYQSILSNLTSSLKENYHKFYSNYVNYNLEIGNDFNLLFAKKKFMKLRGFWEETEYENEYSSELDFIIYYIFKINITNDIAISEKKDIENLLFFRNRTDTHEKINSIFVKLIYYIAINYEFVYKDIFAQIQEEINIAFNKYINMNTKLYILLECIGLFLYIIFYFTVCFYLFYSNKIIIKNIIFLFLDFSEKFYDKNKSNSNIISLKLLEFQNLIDDFDLKHFEQYSKNLDNLNVKKSNDPINNDIKSIFNLNINPDNSNSKIENKNDPSMNSINNSNNESNKNFEVTKKDNQKLIKISNDEEINSSAQDSYNRTKLLNNSSYIKVISSFSYFFREKLNKNKKEIISNNNNNSKNSSNNLLNKNLRSHSLKRSESEEEEINFQEILLNKSNLSTILIIKIFILLILILIFIIIGFNLYKLKISNSFRFIYMRFYDDFSILSNRYTMLFYFYNTFKTLLIFPIDDRKKKLEDIFEQMNEYYEDENNKYNIIIANHIINYFDLKEFFYILMGSNNNSTYIIRQKICADIPLCLNYLNSSYNIFDSGVDFAFRTGMTQVSNYYKDYKKLINKTDIEEIKSSIINSPHFKFLYITNSLNNLFLYVKQKIFDIFLMEETFFNKGIYKKIGYLNMLAIAFSILIFLFVKVYVFISIGNYTKPIKDSTYRINCSFYFIKKYNINNNRKKEHIKNNSKF